MNSKNNESKLSVDQRVYLNIKDKIMSTQFHPGENLHEDSLRTEFKVSRTPVRMALCRLEQEGLVSHKSRLGYFVRNIRLSDIQSLFQVREYLEVPSVQLACKNATEEELRNFKSFVNEYDKVLSKKDIEVSISMGVDFHYRIAIMSKNEILCDFVKKLNEKISIVARIIYQSENHMEKSQTEHNEIMDAIVERDEEKAKELAKEHIRQSSKRFMLSLQSNMEFLTVTPNR